MKIAYIIPALKRKGPVIVAKDIIEHLADKVESIDILHFDGGRPELEVKGVSNMKVISFTSNTDLDHYDVIHSHSLRPDIYTSLKRNSTKAKFVTTVHNYVEDELSFTYNRVTSYIFSKVWTRSWRNKDAVVYLSNDMKNYYESRFLKHDNAHIIPNGRSHQPEQSISPLGDEDAAAILRLKNSFFICGMAAQLTKRKNAAQLIELVKEVPHIAAVIVGDGPELDSLMSRAKTFGIEDRCLFVGFRSDVTPLMKLFDCYVMCSYSEGFGLVILESGLVHVPVICRDNAMFRELFRPEEVCFYDGDSMTSMKSSLEKIISRGEIFARNLNEAANTRYSVQKMADSYLKLYQSL